MHAASSGSLKSGCTALTSYTAHKVHDWLLAEQHARFAPNNTTEYWHCRDAYVMEPYGRLPATSTMSSYHPHERFLPNAR